MPARATILGFVLLLALSGAPAHAEQQSCTADVSSAINVTLGDFLSQGDTPSCSLTFLCRSDTRGDCTAKARGTVTGQGLVGVAVIIDDAALAECWAGLGSCTTSEASRAVDNGEHVTVTCVFRNGVSSAATIGCNAELA